MSKHSFEDASVRAPCQAVVCGLMRTVGNAFEVREHEPKPAPSGALALAPFGESPVVIHNAGKCAQTLGVSNSLASPAPERHLSDQ